MNKYYAKIKNHWFLAREDKPESMMFYLSHDKMALFNSPSEIKAVLSQWKNVGHVTIYELMDIYNSKPIEESTALTHYTYKVI